MRIVCLTSNGYINCIEPFAYYWNKFAGTLRQVTVVCYDILPEGLPDNFHVVSVGKQANHTWSTGLEKFLDSIKDDTILLMLDDYFLTSKLDWHRVEELHRLFLYSNVVKIDLTDDRLKVPFIDHGIYGSSEIIESTIDAPFQTSVQAALWRVNFLVTSLARAENAWQYEKNGTERVREARKYGFNGQILGAKQSSLYYANAVGGEGHKPGVIEAKHMPPWMFEECVAKGWATE